MHAVRRCCMALFVLAGFAGHTLGGEEHPDSPPRPPASPTPQDTAPTEGETSAATASRAPGEEHPLTGYWEVRIRRDRKLPRILTGSLCVGEAEGELRATLTLDDFIDLCPFPVELGAVTEGEVTLHRRAPDGDDTTYSLRLGGDTFRGHVLPERASDTPNIFLAGRRVRPPRFDHPASESDLPRAEPTPEIDASALDRLIHYAERRDSDALVVVMDGRVICDRTFLRQDQVLPLDEVTQPLVSLGIARLEADDRLPAGIDSPVSHWVEAWQEDERRSRITLRHVLEHTTGLEWIEYEDEAYARDALGTVVDARLATDPGRRFYYGGAPFELLGAVAEGATGQPLPKLLRDALFEPLSIRDGRWSTDGHDRAFAADGLWLTPMDLARIGVLVANRGRLEDAQLFAKSWFDRSFRPSRGHSEFGWAWMLGRDLQDETIVQTPESIDRLEALGYLYADDLRPLVGQRFESRAAWQLAAGELLDDDAGASLMNYIGFHGVAADPDGPVKLVHSRGRRGQALAVIPERRLVVVRLRNALEEERLSETERSRATMNLLHYLVLDLVR